MMNAYQGRQAARQYRGGDLATKIFWDIMFSGEFAPVPLFFIAKKNAEKANDWPRPKETRN